MQEEGFHIIPTYIQSVLRSRNCSFVRSPFAKYVLLALVFAVFVFAPDSDYTAMLLSERPQLRQHEEVKLSLWLLPPDDISVRIQSQINAFTQRPGSSASFEPHVTVVGGITCESSEQVQQITKALELGLSGFGGVPVHLKEQAETQDLWNQALYIPVDASGEFVMLCQYCREILGMDDDRWEFPQPAGVPHLSLYYGTEHVPSIEDVEKVEDFVATRAGLWKTDPATVEGVEMWRPVAFFDLQG